MSWAGRQRAFIITIVSVVVLAALAILSFSVFYKVPTCTDRKQNQDEQGPDCGGSCSTLCAFQIGQEPFIKLVRPITPQEGRTDVIAYVENRNGNAQSSGASFLLEVYGAQRQLIAKKTLMIDLPALTTVPVYVPDVAPRGAIAAQAFLTPVPEATVWKRAPAERPVLPTIERVNITEGERPRITAVLMNPLARPVYDTTLVATVFGTSGNAVAASQTLVTILPSQGETPVVFTWNAPFDEPVARVEILPVPDISASAP